MSNYGKNLHFKLWQKAAVFPDKIKTTNIWFEATQGCMTGASSAEVERESHTYTTKVLVQQLHISVDHLKREQFVVGLLHAAAEVETSVPARRPRQT